MDGKVIGILGQPRIPQSEGMAMEIAAWLAARGVASWTAAPWDADENLDEEMARASLLVVLGGDGSTLRAARWTVPYGVPILGINLGRVGFLSEAQPADWPEKLEKVLQGAYWIERRLLIHAQHQREGQLLDQFVALNEVVIGRGAQSRTIQLHLWVDEDLVATYTADGLIVATPTGSTAYAMAAGGPLLPPQLQNIIVVPVAPHLSFNRSLVLHEGARIAVKVEMSHEANLTVDGQRSVPLVSGDCVLITKYEKPCHFVRVESSGYFYRRLMQRLGHTWPRL
jgi:NAD+ kinase